MLSVHDVLILQLRLNHVGQVDGAEAPHHGPIAGRMVADRSEDDQRLETVRSREDVESHVGRASSAHEG